MAQPSKFFKNNPDDKIWWVDDHEKVGEWLFSFDKKHILQYCGMIKEKGYWK